MKTRRVNNAVGMRPRASRDVGRVDQVLPESGRTVGQGQRVGGGRTSKRPRTPRRSFDRGRYQAFRLA